MRDGGKKTSSILVVVLIAIFGPNFLICASFYQLCPIDQFRAQLINRIEISPSSEELLINALEDGSDLVENQSFLKLSENIDRLSNKGVEGLIAFSRSSTTSETRWLVAQLLPRVQNKELVKGYLLELTKDSDQSVRLITYRSLGNVAQPGDGIFKTLVSYLNKGHEGTLSENHDIVKALLEIDRNRTFREIISTRLLFLIDSRPRDIKENDVKTEDLTLILRQVLISTTSYSDRGKEAISVLVNNLNLHKEILREINYLAGTGQITKAHAKKLNNSLNAKWID